MLRGPKRYIAYEDNSRQERLKDEFLQDLSKHVQVMRIVDTPRYIMVLVDLRMQETQTEFIDAVKKMGADITFKYDPEVWIIKPRPVAISQGALGLLHVLVSLCLFFLLSTYGESIEAVVTAATLKL